MAQLTRGMFGAGNVEVDLDAVKAVFGFASGNYVRDKIVHDGVWFNKAGDWLGWGDLNPANLQRLMSVLEDGEMFVILNPSSRPKAVVGQLDTTPGNLAKWASYIVVKGSLCLVDREGYSSPGQETLEMECGITAKVLTPDALSLMLGVTAE